MRFCLFTLFISLLAFDADSQVTFSDDIAELIYTNCGNCHRPGEIGPFSLTNYDEISGKGSTIKYVTQERIMPPWKADPDNNHFIGESILTQNEIDLIGAWVDSGMERGDPSAEPQFPDYPEGSLLGEPDLVLSMTEAHLHRGNNRDSYYYFVLPTGTTEDKVVKSMEFRPGNAKIVHHALIFEDTQGIASQTDAGTSEYGFEGFGGFDGDENNNDFIEGKQFQPYAPGQKAVRYQDGTGRILKAGADLAVQIHYAPVASDEWDQSSINIFFADEDEEVTRFIDHDVMLPFHLNTGAFSFFMAPGEVKEFVGEWTMPVDRTLIGIFPHAHLLGKEWEAWVEHTDGSTTPLVHIPEYDFNWQAQYYFNQLVKAEAGSKVVGRAVYDNTADNPNNPSSPPQFVSWGENTTDEMFYLPFLFVPYEEGDEDIIFDPSLNTEEVENDVSRILPLYPNPVKDRVHVPFYLKRGMPLEISILDIDGRLVRTLRKGEFYNNGYNSLDFMSSSLNPGIYLVHIEGKGLQLTQKFVKAER